MQAETFGGWLSLRRNEDQGTDEVTFSFAIAVSDFTDLHYFKNVLQTSPLGPFDYAMNFGKKLQVQEMTRK
jgi:hypothetical protein